MTRKSLFNDAVSDDEGSFLKLHGVESLEKRRCSKKERKSISLFKSSDDDGSSSTSSSCLQSNNNNNEAEEKENLELPELFENSMTLSVKKRAQTSAKKRAFSTPISVNLPEGPKRKIARIEKSGISASSFYSAQPKSRYSEPKPASNTFNMFKAGQRSTGKRAGLGYRSKGDRDTLRVKVRACPIKKRHSMPPISMRALISSTNNEKLRNMLLNNYAKTVKPRISDKSEIARPLSALSANNNNSSSMNQFENVELAAADFTDSSDDEDVQSDKLLTNLDDNEADTVSTASSSNSPPTKQLRKFFKSGCESGTRKEVTITNRIRAIVNKGKLTLIQRKQLKRSRSFKNEQAKVDAILATLADETPTPEQLMQRIPYGTEDPVLIAEQKQIMEFLINHNICNEHNFHMFIVDPDNHFREITQIINRYENNAGNEQEFRARLPYNTENPDLIAQQQYRLNLLVKNNACSEENFDLLIAHSDTDDAKALLKTLEDEEQLVPADTTTAEPKEFISKTPQKFYPIFTEPMKRLKLQSNRRAHASLLRAALGVNQYQIDAGQKRFGAQHCQECGLIYSAHEPEDERLHNEYHSSINVLHLKSWIDEEIVSEHPEWSKDGRIIRLSESSDTRRIERLNAVLQLIDKELGQSMYKLPSVYIAYIAISNARIVGVCVVQPLTKASKYFELDGVDYCSEQEYPAKCGISRIWVSSLCQRLHIGTKLMRAVQLNAICGEIVPIEEIAFTAPTEEGKAFAQKLTKLPNFLIYS